MLRWALLASDLRIYILSILKELWHDTFGDIVTFIYLPTDAIKGRKLAWVQAKSLQSCLTLCDPVDCSPPGSSVHGTLQARILEWAAMPSSRGSSRPRGQICTLESPALAGRFFTTNTTWEAPFFDWFLHKCYHIKCIHLTFIQRTEYISNSFIFFARQNCMNKLKQFCSILKLLDFWVISSLWLSKIILQRLFFQISFEIHLMKMSLLCNPKW